MLVRTFVDNVKRVIFLMNFRLESASLKLQPDQFGFVFGLQVAKLGKLLCGS